MAPRQDRRSERGATPAREEAVEVVYSRRAVSDLERLQTLLAERDTRAAATAVLRISEVVAMLRSPPFIGRPAIVSRGVVYES
jgi:plasmid stabilization system protein ParE